MSLDRRKSTTLARSKVAAGIVLVASSLIAGLTAYPTVVLFIPFAVCDFGTRASVGAVFVALGAMLLLGLALVVVRDVLSNACSRAFPWFWLALTTLAAAMVALPFAVLAQALPMPHWPAPVPESTLLLMLAIAPTLPGVGALIAALAIPASSRHRLMFVVPAVIAGTLCGAAGLTTLLILTRLWRCG